MFLDKTSSDPNLFLNTELFAKILLGPKIFRPEFLLDLKSFLNSNFFGPEIFSDLKFFSDPKFFQTQSFLQTKVFYWTQNFL